MLAREHALLRNRKVRRLRRRADHHRVDRVDLQELPVISGRRHRLRQARHFPQPILIDLRNVEVVHPGTGRRCYRTNASAPTRTNDGNVYLVHVSSPFGPSQNVTREPQASDACEKTFNIDPDHTCVDAGLVSFSPVATAPRCTAHRSRTGKPGPVRSRLIADDTWVGASRKRGTTPF